MRSPRMSDDRERGREIMSKRAKERSVRIIFAILNFRTLFKRFVGLLFITQEYALSLYFGVTSTYSGSVHSFFSSLHSLAALFPSHRIRLWLIVIECIRLAYRTKNKVPVLVVLLTMHSFFSFSLFLSLIFFILYILHLFSFSLRCMFNEVIRHSGDIKMVE